MKFLIALAIVFFFLTTLAVHTTDAQCIRGKLRANAFRGVALTPHGDPFAKVSIKLLKGEGEARKTVFETVTDQSGSFSAGSLEPGEYSVWISAVPGIDEIMTTLKLGQSPPCGKRSFLTIKLGIHTSSSDSCEGDVIVSRR